MSQLPPSPPTAPIQYQPAPAFPYALWADRVIAAIIDFAIVLVITLVLFGILFLLTLISTAAAAAAENASSRGEGSPLGLAPCCFCCGAPVAMALTGFAFGLFNKVYLVSRRGYSIGQGFRNLRVVLADGSPVPLGTLVIRLFVQFLLGLIWPVQLLNLLWPLWDEKRQTLHDKAVGTFVIYNKV
jgi:uncharacterized RDD family membrane protein YckC